MDVCPRFTRVLVTLIVTVEVALFIWALTLSRPAEAHVITEQDACDYLIKTRPNKSGRYMEGVIRLRINATASLPPVEIPACMIQGGQPCLAYHAWLSRDLNKQERDNYNTHFNAEFVKKLLQITNRRGEIGRYYDEHNYTENPVRPEFENMSREQKVEALKFEKAQWSCLSGVCEKSSRAERFCANGPNNTRVWDYYKYQVAMNRLSAGRGLTGHALLTSGGLVLGLALRTGLVALAHAVPACKPE